MNTEGVCPWFTEARLLTLLRCQQFLAASLSLILGILRLIFFLSLRFYIERLFALYFLGFGALIFSVEAGAPIVLRIFLMLRYQTGKGLLNCFLAAMAFFKVDFSTKELWWEYGIGVALFMVAVQ